MIIIEGLDGVGKSTLVNYFVTKGMEKYHFDYDVNNMDLYSKYIRVLSGNSDVVLDRSFISEMVYGPVLRGNSKLDLEQYKKLLEEYQKVGSKIIYLTASQETLLERRKDDTKDFEIISKYYEELNSQYEAIINYSEDYIDIIRFNTGILNEYTIQEESKKLVLK